MPTPMRGEPSHAAPPRRMDRMRWPIGNCYWNPLDVAGVFWRLWRGPSRRYAGATQFVPRQWMLAEVLPALTLGFVGDVLPAFGKQIIISAGVREFLEECDYLALNLEGTPKGGRWPLNGYHHDQSILQRLADWRAPETTIVCLANNHAGDGGWHAFRRWRNQLTERRFITVGSYDQPSVVLPEGVLIANGTQWCNVRAPYVATLGQAASDPTPAKLRLLAPHWGWEMHLFPPPRVLKRADDLLGEWDAIIGTHSHCPQPITLRCGRLLATSLGNFHRGDGALSAMYGIALKLTLGPDSNGRWRVGSVHWKFINPHRQEDAIVMQASDHCCLFRKQDFAKL